MKNKSFHWLIVAGLALAGCWTAHAGGSLTVHEWGTFTSFQGGDGALMDWLPVKTSKLPEFVYNWGNPGFTKQPAMSPGGGKFTLMALQRLETPVVYFYSDTPRRVDLNVALPKGSITEWFPRADFADCGGRTGLIQWSNLLVMPAGAGAVLSHPANADHYFTARETDSDIVKSKDETEKFLFYRGLGHFATPLKVTMASDFSVTLTNTGTEPIAQLFVFDVDDNAGSFKSIHGLKPGEERVVTAPRFYKNAQPPGERLADQISRAMAKALVQAGLYPREAEAMVNTWRDSWFREKGLRVMYILPRPWTDRVLPMDMRPTPEKLVRVMVGRAEVLRPGTEKELVADIYGSRGGNEAAAQRVRQTLKSLGRFASPAFNRAMADARELKPEEQKDLYSRLGGQPSFE
jgi:hypothetical protein